MILFVAAHLFAGILIGARYRIGALLPTFAVVAIESIAGLWLDLAAWYVLLGAGIVAVQLGYGASALFLSYRARQLNQLRSFRSNSQG